MIIILAFRDYTMLCKNSDLRLRLAMNSHRASFFFFINIGTDSCLDCHLALVYVYAVVAVAKAYGGEFFLETL